MHELLTERPDLFEPNNQMSFYLTLNKVDENKLKDSIYKTYLLHEVTHSKIIFENEKAYYIKQEKTNNTVVITNEDWLSILKREEKKSFDLKNGEMMRCFIIPSQHKTHLYIFAHHLVGDGKAIMCFIEDLMHVYNDEYREEVPLQLITKRDLQNKPLKTIAKIYASFCNLRWKLFYHKNYTWNDYDKLHLDYWGKNKSQISYHTFTKEETTKLLQKAKALNISMNSLIASCFVGIDNNKHSVGMITSVREKGNRTMANLISGVSSTQQFDANLTFEENAKLVHEKAKESIKKYQYFVITFLSNFHPSIIDGILLHAHNQNNHLLLNEISRLMGYKGNFTRDIGITNLTVLDVPKQVGNMYVDNIVVVAPLISYTRKVICASTFDGKLTLSIHDMNQQTDFLKRGIRLLKGK